MVFFIVALPTAQKGTIDGVIENTKARGFVTADDKRDDGSYEIRYESYG